VGPYLSKEDFLDITAVAQSAPGIMAINVAILTGYRLKRTSGAFFAACGAALPSFIIILLIALFFRKFAENPVVRRIFLGVRPAVVALIMVPIFNLAKSAGVTFKTVWVCVAVALVVWLLQISPVYVVLIAVLCGVLLRKKEHVK
ncbi:MAG: chromate transporter, partial [Elusimicrobiaceae bacterium]|nr:chromate transporter [Elusimicrobiaceae bacterium]